MLFNDPDKANCGGCHLDQPRRDGLPPLFTDHQFEALGVPRNQALAANRDPAYFDLGICGPYRRDLADRDAVLRHVPDADLRNVATRRVFFHNGVFRSLKQVMDFYNFRDVDPAKIYPRGPHGTVLKFDDLPAAYNGNIDIVDPPFNRHPGDIPVLTDQEEDDIIAFLNSLTDGYRRK